MIPIGQKKVQAGLGEQASASISYHGVLCINLYENGRPAYSEVLLPHHALALLDGLQSGLFPYCYARGPITIRVMDEHCARVAIHKQARSIDVSRLVAFLESQRDTLEMNVTEVTT
jgi:hypothetical protein